MAFNDRPEQNRYDYEGRINKTAKQIELDFSKLEGADFVYKSKELLSKNLQRFIQERLNKLPDGQKGKLSSWQNRYWMGLLYALDRNVLADKENQIEASFKKRGVDGLADVIKQDTKNPVAFMRVTASELSFIGKSGEVLYRVSLEFGQDPEMASIIGRYIDHTVEKREEIQTAKQNERSLLAEEIPVLSKEDAKKMLPARDKSTMVDQYINLPLPSRPPFVLDRSFWITAKKPPKVINVQKSSAVCTEYVRQLLLREGRLAKDTPLPAGLSAWEARSALLSSPDVSLAASLHDDLYEKDNRVESWPSYFENLPALMKTIHDRAQGLSLNGPSLVLTLNYQHSHHQKEAAQNGSFNTHMAYCLGEGQRRIEGPAPADKRVMTFMQQQLKLKPEFIDLLQLARVYQNGQLLHYEGGQFYKNGEIAEMKPDDNITLEDVYLADAFYDKSRVMSLTAFLGSGEYLAVDLFSLTAPKEPSTPLDEALRPQRVFYLKPNQTVKEAFMKEVSSEPRQFELLQFYFAQIGFDTSRVVSKTEPIPGPDFAKLENYIATHGGSMEAMRVAELEKRAGLYKQTHPDEKVMVIKSGDRPSDLIEAGRDFFSPGFIESLNAPEQQFILQEMQKLNGSIDLRPITYFDKVSNKPKTETADFQSGSFVWLNREIAETLELKVRQARLGSTYIRVPPVLKNANNKEVSFSEKERQLIEAATSDPLERLILTLILLNEQKTTGSLPVNVRAIKKEAYGYMAWAANKIIGEDIMQEIRSIGLLQVRPSLDDLPFFGQTKISDGNRYFEKYGYDKAANFNEGLNDPAFQKKVFNDFKEALDDDPVLNIQMALKLLRANIDSVKYYLKNISGEKVDEYSPAFIQTVLTLHNRPRGLVYAGLIGNVGLRIGEKLAEEFPELSLVGKQWDPKNKEFVMAPPESRPFAIEWNSKKEDYNQLSGRDQEMIKAYWRMIAQALEQKGVYVASVDPAETVELITVDKTKFLKSDLYQTARQFYENSTKQVCSLLPAAEELKKTAILNYAYRVTNHNQIEAIISQTDSFKQAEFTKYADYYIKKYGYSPQELDDLKISQLNSVQQIRKEAMAAKDSDPTGKNV